MTTYFRSVTHHRILLKNELGLLREINRSGFMWGAGKLFCKTNEDKRSETRIRVCRKDEVKFHESKKSGVDSVVVAID